MQDNENLFGIVYVHTTSNMEQYTQYFSFKCFHSAKLIGLVSVFSAYIFSASPSFKVSIYREPMVLKDGR